MENNSREFGLFIDGLRMDRNMSREDLCEGVMSLSQYKRYLRGDTSIPNNKLLQIADKLKFTISEIHKLYQDRSNTQLRKIDLIYTMTRSKEYEAAYRLALELREDIFISEYNQLYFDFCFVHLQNKLNMVSDVHVLELYSDIINYPDCLQNESFNWVELNVLFQMILTSSKMENFELVDFMYNILTDKHHGFSVSKDLTLLPNIYLLLGQSYGRQRNYARVVDVVDRGIDHCRKHETSFALASLFLVKAFAHWALDERDAAIEAGRRSIMQLYVENNTAKISEYKQRLSKGFDLDFNQYCEL